MAEAHWKNPLNLSFQVTLVTLIKVKKLNCLFLISLFLFSSCKCDILGSHNLGKYFTLLEGDKTSDRLIIYCPPKAESKCCLGGMPVIPSIDDKKTRYIDIAKSNEKWIIAKAINYDKTISYWLIDKDFEVDNKYKDTPLPKEEGEELMELIQSHITGPLNLTTFNEKIKELNIDLNFD